MKIDIEKSPDPKISELASDIMRLRYLKQDSAGRIIETPKQMFARVAENIAKADLKYGTAEDYNKIMIEFFKAINKQEFVPASPILMNAGNELQQLFSDYVLNVPDNMQEIFEVLKKAATIHQHGAGTGFSFSDIRPKRDNVGKLHNVAFGPITVMKIFEVAIGSIKQGGRRPGANMGVLYFNHPDIFDFMTCKKDGTLSNFNISVALTDSFIKAL